MKARSPVPFCVAAALAAAACAGPEEAPADAAAGPGRSAIARDYLGSGPPPSPPPAESVDQPHEFNRAERWIADHLPWVPPWVGR